MATRRKETASFSLFSRFPNTEAMLKTSKYNILTEKHTNKMISSSLISNICQPLQTLEITDCLSKPFIQRDRRRPPMEHLPGKRNVRLPLLRIIGRQRTENDLRAGACEADDMLCQFKHRKLVGVAQVDPVKESSVDIMRTIPSTKSSTYWKLRV